MKDQTLELVERGMPVRLIATFDPLVTTNLTELVIEACKKARKGGFSEIGPIIGIFSSSTCQPASANEQVLKVCDQLGPDDLISGEASLLQFVYSADWQPRRLVLEGTTISGLVTLSDIKKLRVRMSLFSLFIHFELLLSDHLRHVLGNQDPIALLPAN
jgi:hypothetical protein